MEKNRGWFNVLAIVTLACFAVFCSVVTWASAAAPKYRKSALEGYEVESTRFSRVRFRPDDSRVDYAVIRYYRRSEIDKTQTEETASTPTGHLSLGPAARDFVKSEAAMRRLLSLAGFDIEFGEPIAISHDHRELAVIAREPHRAVVLRAESGRYRSLAGTPLPDWAERLNTTRTGTTAERLANPVLAIWADAAIESIMNKGVHPAVAADRLLAGVDTPGQIAMLADLLLAIELPETLDEVARVATGNGTLAKRLLDGATQRTPRYLARPDGMVVPAPQARAAVVEALVKRDWGDKPSAPLVDWTLGFLEVGGLETVSRDLQKAILVRLKLGADSSHEARLAAILTSRSGPDGAVAYLLLRGLAGQPLAADPDSNLVEEGRAWLAARRKDK
jgi:hypothetical protein